MKRWWIYAPVALCFVLMPWLAYQQYVWLGQLSVDEEDRLRRGLERTAEQLQARFYLQFAGLQGRGRMGPPRIGPSQIESSRTQRIERDAQKEMEAHYGEWRQDARFPVLISAAYARVGEQTPCLEYQLSDEKWVAAEPEQCRFSPNDRWVFARPNGQGGVLVFHLDPKEVRDRVLPALAVELGLNPVDYSVDVIEGAQAKQGDASIPLLLGGMMGRGRSPFSGGGGPPMLREGPARGSPQMAGLQLVLTRKGESLREIVTAARRRNLALSFVVMLVLLSALILMAWVARRSEELARRQMDFMAGVSHELRTPLAVICSAGENLADGVAVSEERVKRYGRLIAGEGRHLGEMVEEILGYARGTKSPELWKRYSVAELVDGAMAACSQEIEQSGCKAERQFEAGELQVEGERRALIHAIRNLVSNAAKYGREGGWIGVTVKRRGKMAEIAVADHGPGFGAGEGKKIFAAFYRGKRALAEQVHGLGLGLTLVQRVAEMHGGKVEAQNENGACFRLLLPLAKEES